MAGVVAIGECMVELALNGPGTALVSYAGDTFNTAVYLRRLGRAASYATALGGGDPFSGEILRRMDEEGVGRELVVEAPNRLPGLYAIEQDGHGNRRFYYWRGEAPARDYLELADLGRLEAAMRAAELVYVSGITLAVVGERGRALLLPLLAKMSAAGVPVAVDANYRARLWPGPEIGGTAMRAAIGNARYASLSDEDVEAIGGAGASALAQEWAAKGVEVVLRHKDRRIEVTTAAGVESFAPPHLVPVVDTTGAGDAFNAAYLAARLKGQEISLAVAAARRLAAVVVQHPGAIIPKTAMPD